MPLSDNIDDPQARLRELIETWEQGEGLGRHLTAMRHLPAQEAEYGPWPDALDNRLEVALQRRGIAQLYSHQSDAIRRVMDGRHTVVVTPTASGKTLCYNLPVLDAMDDGGTALYLFPTKALSRDQTAELNAFVDEVPGADGTWEARVYDGDTPSDVRRRIRRKGRIVMTNPDMLHAGILPHHDKWARVFQNLSHVVIDEIHTYRGVFGSHVANVMRRLRRVCDHYGADPTFVATSATIGNPRELASTITGRSFELVDDNGAPHSEQYLCFYNPPIVDAETMRRQSPLEAAEHVAREVLARRCGTILFARSRRSVEVVLRRLRDRLQRKHPSTGLHDKVASYRGGYLPDLRRDIERNLREGDLLGVVSTNALELGIDIGSLDVCIQAGYPGTVASTWQQIGRAGRGEGTSLAVLVAGDLPVDQFVVQHSEYFMGQNPEEARVDPGNLLIATDHLECAAYELEMGVDEAFGELSVEATQEALAFLSGPDGVVQRVGSRWTWTAQTYPASEISLRDIAEDNFVVVDETHGDPEVIAEVDFESAHRELYPNAVYQVEGDPYRVERLDYDERRAYVQRSDDGYYTTAQSYSAVHVLEAFESREVGPARIHFGEIRVTEQFVGYKKIKFKTGENLGYGEINLPELDLHTMAYWLQLEQEAFGELAERTEQWARTLQGLGEVLQTAASLNSMCDPRDLGMCIGSETEDRWLSEDIEGLTVRDSDGQRHAFGEDDVPVGFEHHEVETRRVGARLESPAIYIYDCYPGGVGLGEGLYDHHLEFVGTTRQLVTSCDCEEGCPSCIGPPDPDEPPIKSAVQEALDQLVDGA